MAHGTLDPKLPLRLLMTVRNYHVTILSPIPQTVKHTDDSKYASPAEQNRLLAAIDADYLSLVYGRALVPVTACSPAARRFTPSAA